MDRFTVKLNNVSLCLLVTVLLLSVSLRFYHVLRSPVISHDEAITYLAVAGHEGDYAEMEKEKKIPYGQWVQSEVWKDYLEPKDKFIFLKIKDDLTHYDVHPPIYFWLLHCWVLLVGVHSWSGPSMNILLSIINVIILFHIAMRLLNTSNEVLLVVVAYLLSPGVWSSTFIARNYELFTLLTLLLFLCVINYLKAGSDKNIAFCLIMSLIIYVGTMTHYYFALMVIAVALLPLVAALFTHELTFREGVQKTICIVSATALSAALFLVTNPGFIQQVSSFESQGQGFTLVYFILRCLKTFLVFPGFFVEVKRSSIPLYSMIIFILFLILLVTKLFLGKSDVPAKSKKRKVFLFSFASLEGLFYPCMFFLAASAMMVSLYISFFTHQAVMGPRYFSPLYPFFAFIPVLICRFFSLKIYNRDIFIYTTLFFFSALLFTQPWKTYHSDSTNNLLYESNRIIIDNSKRGILLKNIMHIPDGKMVYCAMQDDLLAHKGLLNNLTKNDLYFSHLMYGNTEEKRNEILEKLQKKHGVSVPDGGKWGIWGSGKLYLIGK